MCICLLNCSNYIRNHMQTDWCVAIDQKVFKLRECVYRFGMVCVIARAFHAYWLAFQCSFASKTAKETLADLCKFESYSHAHHTITHFTTDQVHNTLHLCVICVLCRYMLWKSLRNVTYDESANVLCTVYTHSMQWIVPCIRTQIHLQMGCAHTPTPPLIHAHNQTRDKVYQTID